MPVSRKAHQTQLPATPLVRTMLVTRFGVSVLNVVATIDTPMSHHGADRPDVKNSAVLEPARRAKMTAGMNDTMIDAATITQSSCVRRMLSLRGPGCSRSGQKTTDLLSGSHGRSLLAGDRTEKQEQQRQDLNGRVGTKDRPWSPSSNRTGGFPASGFPTRFT